MVRGCGMRHTKPQNQRFLKSGWARVEKAASDERMEQNTPVPLVVHVNNTFHSNFSNVLLYIDNQWIYKSYGLYAYKPHIFHQVQGSHVWLHKSFAFCDYKEPPKEIVNVINLKFFSKSLKKLGGPYGFMLYSKIGVDLFSTSVFYTKNEGQDTTK